jgi:hypothetical protein
VTSPLGASQRKNSNGREQEGGDCGGSANIRPPPVTAESDADDVRFARRRLPGQVQARQEDERSCQQERGPPPLDLNLSARKVCALRLRLQQADAAEEAFVDVAAAKAGRPDSRR